MKHLCAFFITTFLLAGQFAMTQTVKFQISSLPEMSSEAKPGLRGSTFPLSWEKSITLVSVGGGIWETSAEFNTDGVVEYKFVIEDGPETSWELGMENRTYRLDAGDTVLNHKWDVVDPSILAPLCSMAIKEDFKILESGIRSLHPGIYRYNTEAEFETALQELKSQMLADQTYEGQYRAISLFLAKIQCGHTYANFYNQSKAIKSLLIENNNKLPFGTRWIEDHLYITMDASGNSLPAGTEIVSIDNVPSSEILSRLMPYVKSDGANDDKRRFDLGIGLNDRYESFDVYYPLEFPIQDESLRCELSLPDGTRKTLDIPLTTAEDRRSKLQESGYDIPTSGEDTWKFSMVRDDLAYLKLGTFSIWNFDMNWKKFLNGAFNELRSKNVPNLVIDIRGNEGGADEVLAVLGKNLMNYSCGIRAFDSKVRYQKLPNNLRPYVGTWDTTIYDLSKRYTEYQDGYYQTKKDVEIERLPGSRKAYEGNVYVLIDASNSSATMLLSRYIKECRLATLVGQQTGGSLQGINGGNMFFVNLPNSRIEFDIPVYGMFDEDAAPGGVEPDIEVVLDRNDLITGKDALIEAVITEIDNAK